MKIIYITIMLFSSSLIAQDYVVPPSKSTYGHVPVISDKDMKECVILYNEGEWLSQKLETITVDNYSQESIDSYNAQVDKHSLMIDRFNKYCAGKQSQSAYDEAQKLNQQRIS